MAPRTMTDEHKAALAEGREQGRKVGAYLQALDAAAPKKRGRRRTPDSIRTRLEAIGKDFESATALKRLELAQERRDLEAEMAALEGDSPIDLDALRADFVASAKDYAERKGISYAAFREVGVPADALKDAGIPRAS